MAITRLFNTVNAYAQAAINASAAELLLVDVDAPAGDTTVTFPASATVGQVIGIQISVASATKACFGAGPVDVRPFSLHENGDCALWSWDGTTWQSIAQFHNPVPDDPAWLSPGGGTTPVNGDYTIDSGSSTITLPDAPNNGTFIAVKSTNGSTTVTASGADSIDQGDGTSGTTYLLPNAGAAAIFVYDSGTWWIPGIYNTRPALKPTQETGNFSLTLGHLGQLIEITNPSVVTLPDQSTVAWPANAAFDFVCVQGGSTFVDGGTTEIKIPAGFLAEAAVAYSRVRIEKLPTTDEWVISGQLAV